MKKSRGITGGRKSGGNKSIRVSRGAKVSKVTKQRMGAKGKMTLDYDSDDFLELELSKLKVNSRMNKTKVQEELKWTGEETNFAEMMNHFCRNFLFPKFKLLKDGILPDKKNSFYSLCMRHLMIPEGADDRDIWERVIVPSVMRKYQHMKCNLNNVIKLLYMSTTTCLCKSTFTLKKCHRRERGVS